MFSPINGLNTTLLPTNKTFQEPFSVKDLFVETANDYHLVLVFYFTIFEVHCSFPIPIPLSCPLITLVSPLYRWLGLVSATLLTLPICWPEPVSFVAICPLVRLPLSASPGH